MTDIIGTFFSISSGVIAGMGAVTNAISLSFFTRKADRSLGNSLFIFLNVFDLLVCVFDAVFVTLWYTECKFQCNAYRVSLAIMDISLACTGFATCLISITRTISLCLPFYRIDKKVVLIATAVFLAKEFIGGLLRFYFYYVYNALPSFYIKSDNVVQVILLSLIVLISIVSTFLSARHLLKSKNNLGAERVTDTNKKATITVIIISTLFCFFNTFYVAGLLITALLPYKLIFGSDPLHSFRGFALWLAVPLNSALNPVVYIVRKNAMRVYVKELSTIRTCSVCQQAT